MSYLNYVPIPKKKKNPNKKGTSLNSIDSENKPYTIIDDIDESAILNRKKYSEFMKINKNKQLVKLENVTDISKKYMDFDSTYRNRNLYPNPCDYNVPIFYNNVAPSFFSSNYENYIDLIDDATPISNSSKPAELNVTGFSKDELHIQLDQAESNIVNFYVNTTIEIDGDFRNVVYYDNVTKIVTIDSPFVAIPPPGRPYIFRKFKNFFTANVTPIELTYVPGQDLPIVNQISGDKTVYQLSILSSNFSITKQLYLNSIIRFLNGPHKEKTSSIIGFDQIIPSEQWIQEYYGEYNNPNNQSDMELLSYYNSKGISFTYTNTFQYYAFALDIRVFSSQSNRLLLIEILTGDLNVPSSIQYYRTTELITVPPYTEQTITIFFKTPVVFIPQNNVNIFFQDITDGGNANGFINLICSNSSNIDVSLLGFESVPYLEFNGFSVDPINQLVAFGENSFVSTSIEQGIRIYNSGLSLPLYFILDSDVFDDTTNRLLQVKIIEGQNLNNTVVYSNTISLNNSIYNPAPVTIFNNYTLSNTESYTTFWLYSTGSANLLSLPDGYNNNKYPASYVVPSDINQNSYILVTLTGNSVTGLTPQDLTLYIKNSGTNVDLYTSNNGVYDVPPLGGAFTIKYKIDNSLNLVLNPEQNLDFVFGITSNINSITNPITNFTMTLTLYNYTSNQIELYKLDTPLNINSGASTFTNTNFNSTCWLYSGAFNYLPNGYNDLALPSSYTIPANYQSLASMNLTFNGFTDGILNANDFILKINVSGTSNTLKTFYNPSVNTVNFSIDFYINSSDNVPFVANQQLDFILCIRTTYNTFRYTQLNVNFRYIDNSYYTGSLVYLNPNSYYTVSFSDVTAGGNNTGYINLNGYVSAPEATNTSSLITTNFNGFCPCLRIDAINIINNNQTTIWDNFSSVDFIQSQPISTSIEQYVYFVSDFTGNITDIILNLMIFQSTTPGPPRDRILQINFYDSANVLIFTGTVSLPYTLSLNSTSSHFDVPVNLIPSIPVINGNSYSFSVRDVTGDNNANGYIYIYGGNTNYVLTRNFEIFPRFLFNASFVGPITINNSTLNPFDVIPVGSEVGFEFIFNQNIAVVNPFIIALSSFSSLNLASPDYVDVPNNSQRTIRIRYRFGAGLAGAVLYQRDYQLNNLLEPYITSIFLSDLSLNLLGGQPYTITFEDVTSTGNTLGYTFFYGIDTTLPPAVTLTSYNTPIYPLLYLARTFYYVTISPAVPLNGFLNNGFDEISFNSLIRENSRPLNYRGLPYTEIKYYEIRLKYLIMPNKILKVGNGGYPNNYPFFFVEIFNEGDRGNTSIMFSNNTNQNVIFKVYIDKTYYDQPTSFFVLKTYNDSEQRQILAYRPDKDTRIRILMPDGQTVVQYQENDYLSPSYPNPLLQTNILLSIRPLNNYNALIKNDFVELFE
jgi:hypothetical protein